jgi:hypothetical protein
VDFQLRHFHRYRGDDFPIFANYFGGFDALACHLCGDINKMAPKGTTAFDFWKIRLAGQEHK